jgi:hypothetical protein
MAIDLEHCSQRQQANDVVHPVTGKEMEYSALMKDPVSNHFGLEGLLTNMEASSK